MFFKILFVLAAALEFVFVPLFLKYSWPDKCIKSFWMKMICSALFFSCGLLSMKISGNQTQFAKLIIWGLLLGWLGDMFLHLITDKIVFFGLGLFSFLAGHLFYIAAFQKVINFYDAGAALFKWYEILAIVLIMGLVIAYTLVKKVNFKTILAVPVVMYAITISAMLVKAFSCCFAVSHDGLVGTLHIVMTFITIGLGALLFVLSDGSLGIILFAGQKKNRPLKVFNIATYYAAQVLLAASLMFVEKAL